MNNIWGSNVKHDDYSWSYSIASLKFTGRECKHSHWGEKKRWTCEVTDVLINQMGRALPQCTCVESPQCTL